MPRTLVLHHEIFLQHDLGPGFAECPDRLRVMMAALRPAPEGADLRRSARVATEAELLRVHTPAHVAQVTAQRGSWGEVGPEADVCPGTVDCAEHAAGAAIEAVEDVLGGVCDHAFALVRPPGHHATPSTGMGFCIYNNVAVAAAHARALGVERVSVLDWDVHHGNGTQDIAWDKPWFSFASVHQAPLYPGSGGEEEVGATGNVLNLPLGAGADDDEVEHTLRTRWLPWVRARRPGLILVSCGFDMHRGDPLAGMWMSAAGFGRLTRVAREAAAELCGGRLVMVLEGGYRLQTLGDCAHAVVSALVAP